MLAKRFTKGRGKYGRSKLRVFFILNSIGWKQGYGRQGYVSVREPVILSGLPYRSLSKLLPKWVRYEYVTRRACTIANIGDYEYRLLPHGQAWLNCAQRRLHNWDIFKRELVAWVNKWVLVPGNYQAYLTMPFNDMVEAVAEDVKQFNLPWRVYW